MTYLFYLFLLGIILLAMAGIMNLIYNTNDKKLLEEGVITTSAYKESRNVLGKIGAILCGISVVLFLYHYLPSG